MVRIETGRHPGLSRKKDINRQFSCGYRSRKLVKFGSGILGYFQGSWFQLVARRLICGYQLRSKHTHHLRHHLRPQIIIPHISHFNNMLAEVYPLKLLNLSFLISNYIEIDIELCI